MRFDGCPSVILKQHGNEMKLQIRHIDIGARLRKAASFGIRRRQRACAFAQPFDDAQRRLQIANERLAHEVTPRHLIARHIIDMIVKIAAHCGPVDNHVNAVVFKMIRWTNARQHQRLRCPEDAPCKNDGTTRADNTLPAFIAHMNCCRATGFKTDLFANCARHHMQPACRFCRLDIGPRCRPAFTALLRDLIHADAFELGAIKIVRARQLQ